MDRSNILRWRSWVFVIIFTIYICFVFASCDNTADCPECENSFAGISKLSKIESVQGGMVQSTYDFYYEGDLIDSISQSITVSGDTSSYKYKLFYNNCILSGYRVDNRDTLGRNFRYDAGFIVDSNKITGRIDVKYEIIPFENHLLAEKYEYKNMADSTISERLRRCHPGCMQIGRTNFNYYDGDRNVDSVRTWTDEPIFSSSNGPFDDRINPFHQQNGVLYYLHLSPFNFTIPSGSLVQQDVFDFIELCRNNPTSVTKGTPIGPNYRYDFTYTYNSNNLPTLITVSLATQLGDGTYGPPAVVGEVRLTYY